MPFSITKGAVKAPIRAVVYGPEGVGKTTFAAAWPGAVFIDVEGGSIHYDVARMPRPADWNELLAEIKAAARMPEVGTLVIDTADAAEELCVAHIIKKHNKTSMEDWPYQAGWRYVFEEFGRFMAALNEVVAAGKNALVIAHAVVVKFEQPDELGAYDRYELKLHKGKSTNIAGTLKEWSDLLLFANFKADVMTDEKTKKAKATGGKRRLMYASHAAAYDAKNRLGLPDSMPFEFAQIAGVVPGAAAKADEPRPVTAEADAGAVKVTDAEAIKAGALPDEAKERKAMQLTLKELMVADGVSPADLSRAVASRPSNPYTEQTPIEDYATEFVRDVLVAHWDAIKQTIAQLKDADATPGGGVYDRDLPF